MGWIDGDTKTVFVQGVIPLVIGIGLCFLGSLYFLGVLQWSCKRHDGQVAPVIMGGSGDEGSNEGGVTTPEAAERAYGPVACEAQLYGMNQKERQAVLEHIFADCCTHQESKESLNTQKAKEDPEQGDTVNVDIDTSCACAICLRDYEDNEEVMKGSSCDHFFHKSCVLSWLTNHRRPKDHCPYCRKEMMSAVEMKKAALEVLGEERVTELANLPTVQTDGNTTTTMSNSTSQDTEEVPTVEQVPDVESGIQEL